MNKLKEEWLKNLPTKIDRIKIFGAGALPVLQGKHKSLKKEIDKIKSEALDFRWRNYELNSNNQFSLWFWNRYVDLFYGSKIKYLKKERQSIGRSIRIIRGEKIDNSWFEKQNKAKSVPIHLVVSQFVFKVNKSGTKRHTVVCCFHADKNPSMVLYADTNQYHCFGCGAHGDSITFLQQLKKLNYRQAVLVLCKFSDRL